MRGPILITALAVALLAAAAPARAEGTTAVFPPVATGKVKQRHVDRATKAFANAIRGRTATHLAPASACGLDTACLQTEGVSAGAARTVGAQLALDGGDFVLTLVAVDAITGKERARREYRIVRDKLAVDPGDRLLDFLAEAPEGSIPPTLPPPPVVAPEPAGDPAPPVATLAVAATDARTAAEDVAAVGPVEGAVLASRDRDAGDPFAFRFQAGSLVPRGGLGAGLFLGLDAAFSPWSASRGFARRVAFTMGVDWARVTRQGSALVGPPAYPASRADVIQESDLVTTWGGARLRVFDAGVLHAYAGLAVGASISRSALTAYGRRDDENDVAPAGLVQVGGAATFGRVVAGVEVAWRESVHDLGARSAAGEEVMSGLVIAAGVAVTL